MLVESVKISRRDFDAAIFDLDGVLTDTASLHATAWKVVFDTFLQRWARQRGLAFQPFDIADDYLDYVDGRPRDDGIRSFLAARGINLPEGSEHDPDDANTVRALGERKTRLFLQALQKGIDSAAGAEALLKKLREVGIRAAVGSSSKNASAILQAARLEHQFDVCVDGLDAEALRLPGKPDPALFLEGPAASTFSRRVQSCLRMRWLGSKPANGAGSDAWSASITASNVGRYVNAAPM
jgi:beta-phosphoglucomutase-like phosphatase (HAD superfamily)